MRSFEACLLCFFSFKKQQHKWNEIKITFNTNKKKTWKQRWKMIVLNNRHHIIFIIIYNVHWKSEYNNINVRWCLPLYGFPFSEQPFFAQLIVHFLMIISHVNINIIIIIIHVYIILIFICTKHKWFKRLKTFDYIVKIWKQ